MADVFVSYRSTDREIVRLVAHGLASRGLDVWFDEADIYPGEMWRQRILDGLRTVGAMIVAVGPTGIGGVQEFEVGIALDRAVLEPDLPIIPLVLPHALTAGNMWDAISNRSFVRVAAVMDDGVLDRLADTVRGIRPAIEPAVPIVKEPYPGLRAFGSDQAEFYFGRERDIGQLVALCARPGLVAVIGSSGLGKSSLVCAGLLPRLTATPTIRTWRSVVVSPDADPVRTLLVALAGVADDRPALPAGVASAAATDHGTFLTHVLLTLQRCARDEGLVVVLDQLEELFTVCRNEVLRQAYIDNVSFLIRQCPSRVRLVTTLRSDYLAHINKFAEFAGLVAAHHFLLAPIGEDGLAEVIQRPAWAVRVQLEPGLVDEILRDVRNQPNALPLLAVALHEMWKCRQGDRLTLKSYIDGGRVTGSLNVLAERAVARFLPDRQPLVRSTLLRLVSFAPGAPPTRRRRTTTELAALNASLGDPTDVLDALAAERLVVKDTDTVEFAHDALVVAWARLAGWVETAGADETVRQRVEGAVADWVDHGRGRSHLASAGMLGEAAPLADSGRLVLTADEQAFLTESRRAVNRSRRSRWVVLATASVAALALVVVGLLVRRSAQQSADNRSSTAARMGAQSVRLASDHPALAMALAASAEALSNSPEVRSALVTALAQPSSYLGRWSASPDEVTAATWSGPGSVVLATKKGAVLRCDMTTRSCDPWTNLAPGREAVGVDGRARLVLTLDDGTVMVAIPGSELRALRTTKPAWRAAIDRGGNLVATASIDGTLEIRNPSGQGGAIANLGAAPNALAVSPTLGLIAAAAGNEATLTIVDVQGSVVAQLKQPDLAGAVGSIAFTESGDTIIVGEGGSNDIVLWAMPTPDNPTLSNPRRLVGHDRVVTSLTVDGDRLLSVDDSGAVRQWNIPLARPVGASLVAEPTIGTVRPHQRAVAFSADGREVALVRSDAVVHWDAAGRPAIAHAVLLSGIAAPLTNVIAAIAADPVADRLAAVSTAGLVSVLDHGAGWRTLAAPLLGVGTTSLAFVGGRLVAGGPEAGLMVIDTVTGQVVGRANGAVERLAVAGENPSVVAAASPEGRISVIRTTDLSAVLEPTDLAIGPVSSIALSPDGVTVAVAAANINETGITVLDTRSGTRRVLRGHVAEVTSLAFSPDGKLLVSGSDDRSIRLWSTVTWAQVGLLAGHTDQVTGLSFDRTGSMLLSVSDDRSMRWWDIGTRTPIGPPQYWTSTASGVAAGASVALTRHGSEVVVWDITPTAWVKRACDISPEPLSGDEVVAYLGGKGPRAACP